ncbi:hypothetical protein LCGC14_2476370, partial [marine sediment metagenome]
RIRALKSFLDNQGIIEKKIIRGLKNET